MTPPPCEALSRDIPTVVLACALHVLCLWAANQLETWNTEGMIRFRGAGSGRGVHNGDNVLVSDSWRLCLVRPLQAFWRLHSNRRWADISCLTQSHARDGCYSPCAMCNWLNTPIFDAHTIIPAVGCIRKVQTACMRPTKTTALLWLLAATCPSQVLEETRRECATCVEWGSCYVVACQMFVCLSKVSRSCNARLWVESYPDSCVVNSTCFRTVRRCLACPACCVSGDPCCVFGGTGTCKRATDRRDRFSKTWSAATSGPWVLTFGAGVAPTSVPRRSTKQARQVLRSPFVRFDGVVNNIVRHLREACERF